MSLPLDDTVAALASAPGSAARGILRISGPDVRKLLEDLIFPREGEAPAEPSSNDISSVHSAQRELRPPECRARRELRQLPLTGTLPRRFQGRLLLEGEGCELPVDVLYWPTSRSYTGQPLAELHTVGSPPLLDEALAKLYRHGVRPARAGEFTLRAFLAGRLDLIEAEAVLGVIDAQDHQELETALIQLGGGLSGQIAEVRGDLLDLLAELEAGLDFVEEDIEFVERENLINRLRTAHATIDRLSLQAESRMLSTGRWRLVLAGLPNAGKSCLFNALAGEDAAIVSDIKGTTRDVLLAPVDWDGACVELIDTAGWEASPTELMRQADAQRSQQSTEADLLLLCIARDAALEESTRSLQLLQEIQHQGKPAIVVETKADLAGSSIITGDKPQTVCVSAITGQGLAELKAKIASRLSENSPGGRQLIGTTAARCRESLTSAAESLQEAVSAATQLAGDELIAVELHQSLDHLGRILGTVFTDDILDRIFSKFCIGK